MKPDFEWHDTGQRADQVLLMIACVLLDRVGGDAVFERTEWTKINDLFGGHGALLWERTAEGGYHVYFGTPESVAQKINAPN